ncbi:MAG: hypothetical protein IT369_24510 [Candidatus Latescibacteria bacterium]|nr:hypothetical protein [Candidatus Latescibacterota bacterium]
MAGQDQIEELIRQAGLQGRIVEKAQVSPEDGQLKAGEADGLVTGDVLAGGLVESAGSVVVVGDAQGRGGLLCQIEAGGRVLVGRGAQYAQIAAGDISVGKDVDHCTLLSHSRVQIQGDLTLSRVVIGDFQARRLRWNQLLKSGTDLEREEETLRSQYRFLNRRVLKDGQNTHVNFELNLGQIIQVKHEAIEIALEPIYRVLPEQHVAARDKAVEDFFNRGVIGTLTRLNREYISKNRSRQEVFLKLLRELSKLFALARQIDRCVELQQAGRAEAERLMAEFRDPPELDLVVGGRLKEGNEISFVLPDVKMEGETQVILKRTALLKVSSGATPGICQLKLTAMAGIEEEQAVASADLTGVQVKLIGGYIRWQKKEA